MSLTVNQSLQLLWIHYKEPEYEIGLTKDELMELSLTVVSKYDDITSPYKDAMIPQSKSELVDTLREPLGSEGLFARSH